MAVIKTEFINGVSLSFPIGIFPKLFLVFGARTKRKFFEEMIKLDGPGGEGMTMEQIVEMFQVGLISEIPDITYEQAAEHVQDYITEYGHTALNLKLVDAFCDAGLSDRKEVEKQRKLAEELEKLQDARNEALIMQSWAEVDKLNASLQKLSKELNESTEGENPLEATAQT